MDNKIFSKIQKILDLDADYESGSILNATYTRPFPDALEVFVKNIHRNIGNTNLFPGSNELEKETIKKMAEILKISSDPNIVGKIVSGGSEANIVALWAARNFYKKKHTLTEESYFLAPETTHPSITQKAADILNVKICPVKVYRPSYEVDFKDLNDKIDPELTVAVIGNVGTTMAGSIDPILDIGKLCFELNIWFHIDAAFGGFVTPFMKVFNGNSLNDYYFDQAKASSLTIDPHKNGGLPIPSGGLILKSEDYAKLVEASIPYFTGNKAIWGMSGTRTAGPVVALAYLLEKLGREGYRQYITNCIDLTQWLAIQLKEINFEVIWPGMNILLFQKSNEEKSNTNLFIFLTQKGWKLAYIENYLRIIIMSHTKAKHLDMFISDIKSFLKKNEELEKKIDDRR